jgi:hypothetical protein
LFYYDATEVLPALKVEEHINGITTDESQEKKTVENYFETTYVPSIAKTFEVGDRSDGLRIVVGDDLVNKLA